MLGINRFAAHYDSKQNSPDVWVGMDTLPGLDMMAALMIFCNFLSDT